MSVPCGIVSGYCNVWGCFETYACSGTFFVKYVIYDIVSWEKCFVSFPTQFVKESLYRAVVIVLRAHSIHLVSDCVTFLHGAIESACMAEDVRSSSILLDEPRAPHQMTL